MPWSKKNSSIVLTSYLNSQLDKLANGVDFPIVVTSGVRTARQQAAAMFGKIEAGDSNLGLYLNRDFAAGVVAAYPDLEKAAQVVSEFAATGGGSTHLRAQAFDIRTRDLTSVQIAQLEKAVNERLIGASSILESAPPHLHVTVAPPPKKNPLLVLSLIAAGIIIWSANQ